MLTETRLKMLTKDLSDPKYIFNSPELMSLAIASKKNKRAGKGFTFNCVLANRCLHEDELLILLKMLQQEKMKPFQTDIRFQVIYCSKVDDKNDYHWSVIDIHMKAGKISFFY